VTVTRAASGECLTIYEFDALVPPTTDAKTLEDVHVVPEPVFKWLEEQCLRLVDNEETSWLRLTQRRGRRAVQLKSFVGVILTPHGYQIEVLPKVGKSIGGSEVEARQCLINMLSCLPGFRHVETDSASLLAARMPLWEIFVTEFLGAVEHVVKRGIRSDYVRRQGNLFALRGKWLIAQHLRENLHRADRFSVEYDEFSTDRPENRLLHAALDRVLALTTSPTNQRLARELDFVFADVPPSPRPWIDFQQVRIDRSMGHYSTALAWARLILNEQSPLTGAGSHQAPSLLFPMESVFEAFVARHVARQLARPFVLRSQASSHHLIRHRGEDWFRLKPDLVIRDDNRHVLVLDTKWKLLDSSKANGTDKYGLSSSDFYQLHAYGQSYLDGAGDVILIYPKTAGFDQPLPVFEFPKTSGLRLWVVPFCLKTGMISLPGGASYAKYFRNAAHEVPSVTVD
jgi:5-methylcytosine-specific restriction enzyme subunit McrC